VNRVKFWVFTLLVVAAGYAVIRNDAVTRRSDAVASLDTRLASASAHVSASVAALSREATAAVAHIARDEGLVTALHAKEAEAAPPPPPPKAKGKKGAKPPPPPRVDPEAEEARVRDAARAALEKAEKSFGYDLPQGTVVTAGNREWIARKGEPSVAEGEAMAFLRGAIGGQMRRGPLRLNGALWYAAARPAGEGAGVVLLVPLDERWARSLATAAGADVTITVPDVKPVTTGKPVDLAALQGATKLTGAGDVGTPAGVDVSVGPVKLPHLPQPFAGGAPLRARAVPVDGVKGAFVVLSIPAAAQVDAPAASHWRGVGGLVVVLLVGLVLGFFVRSTEPVPQVPEPLYAAAVRIEKGDFAARAPKLAGKLGTVAAALNRAAEIAGPAKAALGAPPAPPPASLADWPLPVPAAAAVAPDELRAATGMGIPAAAPLRTGMVAAVGAPVPAASFEVDEETHWQQIFQDFLRTRVSCGENAEGLTYDKFRQKLEGNKAQLVGKYGCKTVRFQVYVKDGKAALKATPVK
jgi:hypothetical protein